MTRGAVVPTQKTLAAARRAIKLAGGPAELSRRLAPKADIETQRSLSNLIGKWRNIGVPPRWVGQVSRISGVSRYALAPDVFEPND
jgi:hypothetical protein